MKTQSGNALWFILIAVVLLGILTVVLSRGSGNIDQSGNVEQERIKASKIVRYAKSIEAGIQQMLMNSCSENDISFKNSTDAGYTNPDTPDGSPCQVFQTSGAGLEWRAVSDRPFSSGERMIITSGIAVTGVENNARQELISLIPVARGLCLQINKDLGNSTDITDITSDISSYSKFTGIYTGSDTIGNGAGKAPALTGKQAGCFIDDNEDNVFYQVLIAR